MSDPLFEIEVHPERRLVHVVMRGFWNEATIAEYDREITRAGEQMAAAGISRESLLALVDMRDLNVQTQQSLNEYSQRFAAADRQPGKLATIVSSALVKLQVQRVDLPNQKIFDNEEEARGWLMGE